MCFYFENNKNAKKKGFITGDTCLLAGAWLTYPDAYGTVNRNNSWYLVRRPDGNWHYGQVIDSMNLIPPGNGLQATRTIIKSPFSDEPNTYYFGGMDAGGPNPVFHNTAWIYKGILATNPTGINDLNIENEKSFIYPNPSNTFINFGCKNGFYIYSSTGQLVKQNRQATTQISITDLSQGLYIL